MYNFKRRAQQQVPQQQQEEEEEFALVEEEQPEEAQVDKNDHVHVNTNDNNDDIVEHDVQGDNSVDLPLHHTQDVITAINNNEELQLANAQVVNETEPSLAHDADERTVLMYYRQEVQKHLLVPPRPWRQIRLDLPSTVAELQLYPPQPEMVQYAEPIIPSPCIVILLDGTKPAEMNNNEYMAQMVNYLFELLRYQNASTAMTMVRFVKRGSELSQLVVTFGQDIPLATRVLVELQSAGLAAGFGQPIHDHPPNATFQIVDYKMIMHDGVGITEEDIQLLLEPFRQSDQGDMVVIEGYEPGVYYAPVKRPETVFTFLWNPFCSFLLQSGLFEKYGVLITMAYCPHEFLTKGMPFYLQRKQKEVEQAPNEKLENQVQGAAVISPSPSEEPVRITEEQQKETQLLVDVNSNNKNSYNNDNAQSDADVDVYGEKEQYEPWLDRARDEIDIFDTHTENLTESKVASLSFNARHNPVKSNQTAGALVLNDEDEEEDEDNVFHSNNNQTNVPEQNKFYGSNNDTQHHNVYNVNNNIGSFNNQNQFYSNGSNSVNNNVNNEDYGSHQFSSSSFTMTGNRDNYMTPQAPHNIPLIPPMQFNLDPTLSSLPEQPSSYLPQMNTFDSSNYSNNMNTVSTSLINNQPMIHDAQRTQEPILPDISSEPTNITLYNPQQELSMIPLNDNAHEHFDKPILSETPQQPQQIKEKREVVVEGVQSQTTTLQENEYSNMQLPFTTPTPHYSIPYAPVPFTQPQHQWMPSEFPIPLSSLSSSSLSTFTFANNAPLPYALPTLPSHTFPNMEQPNANGPNMPYITSTPSLQAWNNINNNSYNYNYGSNINNQFVPQAFQPQTQIQQQQLPLSSLSEENVPLAMTVEDAKALIEEIEEQIHIAFVEFKSFHEGTDNDETCALLEMSPEQVVQYNNNASTSELLPYTSAIHVLMQLITASHDRIQFLLQSTETEFTELQMQLAQLLLGDATSVVQERQNQNNSPQENKEEFKEEGEEEEEKKKEEEPRNACNNRIALLPYLLRTQEGVYIASTLAAYYTDKLSHVLIRYVMLYLCQTNIIQTIVLPCLANDSNPHNPLVERLMRY